MTITPGLATVIIILAAIWVAIAALLMILASRRISRANALLGGARSVASLLRSVPARPLIVRPDGGIESDSLLQRDLGLLAMPEHLDQLAVGGLGIDHNDLAALKADVQTAAVSGIGITRQVRIAGSDRAVEVRGGLAPPPYAAGPFLLWLFDATEAFVMLAGYAAGLAYGLVMDRQGWFFAASRVPYLAAISPPRERCGTTSFQVFQPYSPAKTTAVNAEIR